MIEKAKEVRKLIAYAFGVAAGLLSLGLIPAPVDKYVAGMIVFATGLGIYKAENAIPPGARTA